ncbi:Protein kinase [Recurvomyces mirabilis]|uniref:non-specific serine/threonine protein kinase n=1 Tax=Recurvomyces mirabilis TaxID=574656 RepID=A0AAE0WWN0_9PEZI|nr:Protein kinase [Recurvomyces mirabilis]KAK5161306.1 Protein kinase [Recurvomyces mirabilis]
MTSALDDEDLSLSISQTRRTSREDSSSSNATPRGSTQQPASLLRDVGRTATQRKEAARLGQYSIVKTLGEGSFGKVKLAIHQVSNQKVALKIIARRKLVTRDMAGRIEREIQYLQLLRHPHIIKLFTVITTPGDIIMVLEYAGGELFDYIVQHGKMAEEKARKFFQQIVCAVEYCHRHKIVHRDLKPENLLLDENLNVKIADFGLSNIMTDGNFLKTSCGSPNYAAPEVISGKLYAGPEVDVWSCGVILYVLLVGRLPFDDEYIPALFKKIAQGNYITPNYLSSGAVRLIKRMLQVNPVNRITVPEIRQDPWFTKDLPEYLQPPVEDFVDTGVDPAKAIDPYSLSKGKPKPVQEKLHSTVVGKLGKTMGYAPDDVQDALKRDEPSAIKDAYLIVRENTLMKTNPSLAQEQPAFIAASPPAFHPIMPTSPRSPGMRPPPSPLGSNDHPRHGSNASSSIIDSRTAASSIAVLPTSLPDFHVAYMKGHGNDLTSTPPGDETTTNPDPSRPRTKEEQEATARRLKPHSRSSANLHRGHHPEKPEPMTSLPDKHAKKQKPTKWQFGIRSRNTPAEAMLAIYKALRKMGAVWEVMRPKEGGAAGSGEGSPERPADGQESPEYSDSDPDAGTDPEYADHEEQERRRSRRDEGGTGSGEGKRGRERYGRWNDYGYSLPEDPWVIHARFKKHGMFPPGVQHPSSTHSSRVNLTGGEDEKRRRSSTVSSSGNVSLAGSSENIAATGPAPLSATNSLGFNPDGWPAPDESVWVYVTIQLYSIEKDFFLVDFKCAGYERLVQRFAREVRGSSEGDADIVKADEGSYDEDVGTEDEDGEVLVGAGRTQEEKDISSPFPFLDVASRLIIQLAEAND